MKTTRSQLLMILVISTACVFAAVSFAEQTAMYSAEQEGKHMSLAKAREDMNILRACLSPIYRIVSKTEPVAMTPSISDMVPPAKIAPPIVQPDSTAIAASPRPEITTGSEDKK